MNNTDKSSKLDDLIYFIRVQTGVYNLPITRETLIEDELGITGDDAEDLIIAFAKRYGVNIENFNFTKYFYSEPGLFDFSSNKVEPFTIGHLEKAIIAGRLDEEVINS